MMMVYFSITPVVKSIANLNIDMLTKVSCLHQDLPKRLGTATLYWFGQQSMGYLNTLEVR